MTSIKIDGIEEIQKILRELPEREGANLIKATVRGIAAEVNKEAKKRVPTKTGNLKKSLKVKAVRSPKFQPVFDVRAESGRGVKNDGFYWRFIEHGTGGKNPQPEQPFVRPAKDLVFSKISTLVQDLFVKKIAAAAKRKLKAAAKAKAAK
jgi:HK97 gp10 family phage protein